MIFVLYCLLFQVKYCMLFVFVKLEEQDIVIMFWYLCLRYVSLVYSIVRLQMICVRMKMNNQILFVFFSFRSGIKRVVVKIFVQFMMEVIIIKIKFYDIKSKEGVKCLLYQVILNFSYDVEVERKFKEIFKDINL